MGGRLSAAGSPQGPPRRRLWRLATALAIAGLVAPLAIFHAVLLWDRIASLTLFEPAVAARWAATALIVGGLLRLRRAGLSLVRGRRAMVFWLLALFLHLSFAGPAGEAGAMLAPPAAASDGFLMLVPMTAPLALAAGLALLLLATACAAPPAAPPSELRPRTRFRRRAVAELFPILFSRPPPVSA